MVSLLFLFEIAKKKKKKKNTERQYTGETASAYGDSIEKEVVMRICWNFAELLITPSTLKK